MLLRKAGHNPTWMLFAAALLALLPAAASGSILTYFHQGNGSGTLNGQPFGPSDFKITAVVDTNNRQPLSGGWYIDHSSASILIGGLGSFGIVTPTRTFASNVGHLVGFSRAGAGGLDLFNGPSSSAFDTWDMLTPIGPVTGPGGLLQWGLNPLIQTTGGVLIFNDAVVPNATFTAIPEPAALTLLGALGLLARRR